MWSLKAALYPLVLFGADYQRLKRYYYISTGCLTQGRRQAHTVQYCLLGPSAPGVKLFENLLWKYFLGSDGCTAPPRIRQAPPPFTLNRREACQNQRYEDGDKKGEGYTPRPPPPLCKKVSPAVEVHAGSIYRRFTSVYFSFQSVRFSLIGEGSSYPENGGRSLVETAGADARGKRPPPPSLPLMHAYTYLKSCR